MQPAKLRGRIPARERPAQDRQVAPRDARFTDRAGDVLVVPHDEAEQNIIRDIQQDQGPSGQGVNRFGPEMENARGSVGKHLRARDEKAMQINGADVAELVDARDLKYSFQPRQKLYYVIKSNRLTDFRE